MIQLWNGGIGMGHFGTFPFCPLLPMVQWDGIDSWDGGIVNGTLWDIPTLSIASHGTMGWDGQLGWGYCEWDTLGHSHSVHCFPWYNGMGLTVGMGVL